MFQKQQNDQKIKVGYNAKVANTFLNGQKMPKTAKNNMIKHVK